MVLNRALPFMRKSEIARGRYDSKGSTGGRHGSANCTAEAVKLHPAPGLIGVNRSEAPQTQRLLVDSTRRGYDSAFSEWRADVARRWRAAGASYVEVVTDEPPSHAVRRIAELSAAGARA